MSKNEQTFANLGQILRCLPLSECVKIIITPPLGAKGKSCLVFSGFVFESTRAECVHLIIARKVKHMRFRSDFVEVVV